MVAGVLRCVQRGVAIYSPHTALDCAEGGTNDVLAGLCDVVDPRPLDPEAELGIGRIGALAEPLTLMKLARKLKRRTGARCVSLVGDPEQELKRAIVGVGAAGSMPFEVDLRPGDVIVTGEIRHHDALHIQRVGCSAIALSHWSSERPVLASLAKSIETRLPEAQVRISDADVEPFLRV
jgi:putative NIF3 family GTP cyclohydrolase 1 type 2